MRGHASVVRVSEIETTVDAIAVFGEAPLELLRHPSKTVRSRACSADVTSRSVELKRWNDRNAWTNRLVSKPVSLRAASSEELGQRKPPRQGGRVDGAAAAGGLPGPRDRRGASVVVVTDNGPAYRSRAFVRSIGSRPELAHVRTRHRSPGTNGVIERFYEALKYERLYRVDIPDGDALACEVDAIPRRLQHRPPARGARLRHAHMSHYLPAVR